MAKTENLFSKTLLLSWYNLNQKRGRVTCHWGSGEHFCLYVSLRKKKQDWVTYYWWIFLLLLLLFSHLNFWIVMMIRSGQAVSFLHETIWCLSCLFHLVGQCLSISTRTAVQGPAHGSWASVGDGFQVLAYRKSLKVNANVRALDSQLQKPRRQGHGFGTHSRNWRETLRALPTLSQRESWQKFCSTAEKCFTHIKCPLLPEARDGV